MCRLLWQQQLLIEPRTPGNLGPQNFAWFDTIVICITAKAAFIRDSYNDKSIRKKCFLTFSASPLTAFFEAFVQKVFKSSWLFSEKWIQCKVFPKVCKIIPKVWYNLTYIIHYIHIIINVNKWWFSLILLLVENK